MGCLLSETIENNDSVITSMKNALAGWFAQIGGDSTQKFKVANADNNDEALTLGQFSGDDIFFINGIHFTKQFAPISFDSDDKNYAHVIMSVKKGDNKMISFTVDGYIYGSKNIYSKLGLYAYDGDDDPYAVKITNLADGGFADPYYSADDNLVVVIDLAGGAQYSGGMLSWQTMSSHYSLVHVESVIYSDDATGAA